MTNLPCECQELKPKGETNSSFLVLHPLSGVHTVKTVGTHLKQQTFLSSRKSDCRGGLDRERRFLVQNFIVKQDALGNTDGNILFIFPEWYFGALIFSVVNAAAKRRSKFAFDRSQ